MIRNICIFVLIRIRSNNMKEALTFDDVLLVPQKSTASPSKVDTSINLGKSLKLDIPILSAAMDTVTESQMAVTLAQAGGRDSGRLDDALHQASQILKDQLAAGGN